MLHSIDCKSDATPSTCAIGHIARSLNPYDQKPTHKRAHVRRQNRLIVFLLANPGKGLTDGNRCCLVVYTLQDGQGHFCPDGRPCQLVRPVPCHAVALALVPMEPFAVQNHEDEEGCQQLDAAVLCPQCHVRHLQLPCTKTHTQTKQPLTCGKCMRISLPALVPMFDMNAHLA